MRVITSLKEKAKAERLSAYLTCQGIANHLEETFQEHTGDLLFEVWVQDEDLIEQARQVEEAFQKNPSSAMYDPPLTQSQSFTPPSPPAPRFPPRFTIFILTICSFLFFWGSLQEIPLMKRGFSEEVFLFTPLYSALLYDFPPALEQVQKELPLSQESTEQAPQIYLERIPFWKGAYTWLLAKMQGESSRTAEGPLFYKISRGEIWRLFTPALLHGNFLHILFNMLWVWMLSRPIEQRIGFWRIFLLALCLAIGSNTAQYLMTGPVFVGYSGVIVGFAGFIWMRQRIAPWEGYPLSRGTILFLLLFIGGMFALQVILLFAQLFFHTQMYFAIANTAHIIGGALGVLFGKSSFFSQKALR